MKTTPQQPPLAEMNPDGPEDDGHFHGAGAILIVYAGVVAVGVVLLVALGWWLHAFYLMMS